MLRKVAMLALLGAIVTAPAEAGTIGGVMYKDPGCGCCDGHAAALRRAGMDIAVVPTGNDVSVQARRAVPEALRGCHTTIVGGYAVEGHVPVNVVQRMLREKPAIRGIALPGMPSGSPGMAGPKTAPFKVLSFGPAGTKVYAIE